jgi:hypothetical protein
VTETQEKILNLLSRFSDGEYYKIQPATKEQILHFKIKAIERQVDQEVIDQLVELYEIADNFHCEIVLGFHSCADDILFEWWGEKELWLGQRDFNTLRWVSGKFCLGDAGSISYSEDYEYDTLVGLIECCVREIENANDYDRLNSR